MRVFHCSAILFDLDGVLVDSTHSVDRLWRRWGTEHNIDPEQVLAIAHGVRTIEVVQRLAPHLDTDAEVERIERQEADDTEGVVVMSGAAELLQSIPDERWCVVTSGTRYLANARLHLAHLPIPPVLVTANEVKNGKPHPEPYLKGAILLGIDPGRGLVIEDAPAGIRAAHAGGMKVIGLTSTYDRQELHEADIVVESLREIRVTSTSDGLVVEAG